MNADWKTFLLGLILGLWIATAWSLSVGGDGAGGGSCPGGNGGCPSVPDGGKPVVDDTGKPVIDDNGCQVYTFD